VVLEGWKTFRILPERRSGRTTSPLGLDRPWARRARWLLEPRAPGSPGDTGTLFARLKKAVERDTDFGKDPRAKGRRGCLLTATLNVLLSDSVLGAPLPALLREG
jgi:hypothetical protein